MTTIPHASTRTFAVALVASLLVVSAAAPLAAAAGGTSVSVALADRVDVGETTTIQVVVDSADGGVGAAELRVAVADASVAEITGVTVRGSGATETDLADDGSSVDVEYAFRDTADTGSVVIAEVTLRGTERGTTDVTIAPAEGNDAVLVFDENGSGYAVTSLNGASLTVGDGSGNPFPDGVPGVADRPPTDSDGDGTFENVNGDGTFDFIDVIDLLFADWDAINRDGAGRAALDFDDSGTVDFLDAVALLFEL
jgi:hypothetical protein